MFKQSNLFESEILNYRTLTGDDENKRLIYPVTGPDVQMGNEIIKN